MSHIEFIIVPLWPATLATTILVGFWKQCLVSVYSAELKARTLCTGHLETPGRKGHVDHVARPHAAPVGTASHPLSVNARLESDDEKERLPIGVRSKHLPSNTSCQLLLSKR